MNSHARQVDAPTFQLANSSRFRTHLLRYGAVSLCGARPHPTRSIFRRSTERQRRHPRTTHRGLQNLLSNEQRPRGAVDQPDWSIGVDFWRQPVWFALSFCGCRLTHRPGRVSSCTRTLLSSHRPFQRLVPGRRLLACGFFPNRAARYPRAAPSDSFCFAAGTSHPYSQRRWGYPPQYPGGFGRPSLRAWFLLLYRVSVHALCYPGFFCHRSRWPSKTQRTSETLDPDFYDLVVTTLLAALPIVLYFFRHPADFFTRANQLSVFSRPNPLVALCAGLLDSLAQFNFTGDCRGLVNVGCAPLLILPVGLLFVVGMILACRAALREGVHARQHGLLIIWFLVMLLPSVLAGGASALRTIGTIPAVFILAGIAAEFVFERFAESRVARTLFLLLLAASAAFEAHQYFLVWAQDPHAGSEFDAQKLGIGRFLNSLSPSTPRYLVVNAQASRTLGRVHVTPLTIP